MWSYIISIILGVIVGVFVGAISVFCLDFKGIKFIHG